MSKQVLLKNIIIFVAALVAIGVVHLLLLLTSLNKYYIELVWTMYPVLGGLSVATIAAVVLRFHRNKTGAANVYFVMASIKMFGSLLFLLPWILYKNEDSYNFVIQFMIVFFVLLAVETVLITKVLNSNSEPAKKND